MTTPTVTEQLVRIQSEVTSGDVVAFFEKSVTIDGTKFKQPWESVKWNASEKQVSVGGMTLTYSQVMGLVIAIAMQERAEQAANSPA